MFLLIFIGDLKIYVISPLEAEPTLRTERPRPPAAGPGGKRRRRRSQPPRPPQPPRLQPQPPPRSAPDRGPERRCPGPAALPKRLAL